MKDKEALNNITFDILQISKRKNKKLWIALIISIVLNAVLMIVVFDGTSLGDTISTKDGAMVGATVAVKKPSEHIATRAKLRDIADIKTFNDLLDRCILTPPERHLLEQHYLYGRSLLSIALEMGYSEDAIKHRHQKILKKIKKIL